MKIVSGRFFEKKLRKKLLSLQTTLLETPGGQGAKVFLVLFFQKKNFLLSLEGF